MRNVKYEWSNPIFVYLKKHFCPICRTRLNVTKVSKVVNSESAVAEKFDFSSPGGDTYLIGDVMFIRNEFNCPKCNKNYSVDKIKYLNK